VKENTQSGGFEAAFKPQIDKRMDKDAERIEMTTASSLVTLGILLPADDWQFTTQNRAFLIN
jgi:hypothetical protein